MAGVGPRNARAPLKCLSAQQMERYLADGYCHPIRVLRDDEAGDLRHRLEAYERAHGGPLAQGYRRHKVHLLFTWLGALASHPAILDAVEDAIGPNILCWSSTLFIKEAHDPSFVSWHQDATYWGLSSPEVVTAWVALSPSTTSSGAMRVVPGTHRQQFDHRDRHSPHNMLTRGQEVMVDIDAAAAVDLVLQPGEMSLHHVRLVHGSEPNRSDDRRIGYAIRYIPTHVRQITGARDGATLVRGADRYHHFASDPVPEGDLSPAVLALLGQVKERHSRLRNG